MKYLAGFLLLVCAICLRPATAAEPFEYHALGAPARPQVDVNWNRYRDYGQATKLLQDLAKAHPDYVRMQSLGKTYGKREMWLLTISDFAHGDVEEKPAFWIDGGIHANEIQAVEVVLYTAWFLLEKRGESEQIQRLLKERTFYLLPMMSPDARDAHFHEPNTTHSPRSGLRPVDDDGDGEVDEDGADDLDKDGHITQMRVRDKNGRWKAHEKFPELMVRVPDGERGEFTLLGVEGLDNDGDGEVNEDSDGYYDPNRDWAWNWQPGYVQRGAWRYPFSVEENRMVRDFIVAHPQIAGAQTYHNAGGMILRGPGVKTDRFDASDIAVYNALAEPAKKMLPGYRYINVANDLYEVYGGEFDWFHQMQGVFTFNNELWTPFNFFREHDGGGFFGSAENQHLFNQRLLFGEALSPWREVDHPQYGRIEVGGFRKNFLRQPPSFLLEEESHRNMAFTLIHADEMPLLQIESASARSLGQGLVEVTVAIHNPKITPTHAAADVKNRITRPDLVTIEGADLQVSAGMQSEDSLFRKFDEQIRRPEKIQVENVPGRKTVFVRWLVTGKPPFQIQVSSIKGGQAEAKIITLD
ncbi:M14 family metallopeptidase [Lignipirellula cremea]|uniref:Carboxypeptidase T n=1 Tax=Lignipirellula cremea TaxID=2528010 RepID=A0A518DTD8_9BACT|nr:M14 family metallopeptidase [Lignipirellula cremea]QDU95100.1 Carboxypeptidase T precursor [Lignipirellula cremea]